MIYLDPQRGHFQHNTLQFAQKSYKIQGMIPRLITEKLQSRIDRVPAVALLGARQVGKTTLARALAEQRDSIYLDLEMPRDQLKLRDPEGYLRLHDDKLIVLDEIQRSPDLFNILRGIIDENRQAGRLSGQFLILGSASMDLLRQSSESLAGRISYIEMGGLNVLESGTERTDIHSLWFRGGFPEARLAGDDEAAMDWIEDLITTYLERDVPQIGFQVPAARLRVRRSISSSICPARKSGPLKSSTAQPPNSQNTSAEHATISAPPASSWCTAETKSSPRETTSP